MKSLEYCFLPQDLDPKNDTVDKEFFEVPEIKEALALAEEAAYTSEELEAYARNWDAIRTERMLMNDKLIEGLEKGRAEEQAKAHQEKLQIARNLLLKGIDVDTVASATGISTEVLSMIKL